MTRWKLRGLPASMGLGPVYGCDECNHVVQYETKPRTLPRCRGSRFTDGQSSELQAPDNVHPRTPVEMTPGARSGRK